MTTDFSTSLHIDAPIELVWDTLTDVENMPTWTSSMREVRILDGSPLAVGTQVLVVQPRMPRMTWTVDTFEPHSCFSWTAASTGVVTVGTHHLQRAPGGRGTEATFEITHRGPGARIAGALTMARTRSYVRAEIEGLAAHCRMLAEGRPAQP